MWIIYVMFCMVWIISEIIHRKDQWTRFKASTVTGFGNTRMGASYLTSWLNDPTGYTSFITHQFNIIFILEWSELDKTFSPSNKSINIDYHFYFYKFLTSRHSSFSWNLWVYFDVYLHLRSQVLFKRFSFRKSNMIVMNLVVYRNFTFCHSASKHVFLLTRFHYVIILHGCNEVCRVGSTGTRSQTVQHYSSCNICHSSSRKNRIQIFYLHWLPVFST